MFLPGKDMLKTKVAGTPLADQVGCHPCPPPPPPPHALVQPCPFSGKEVRGLETRYIEPVSAQAGNAELEGPT